MTYNTTPCGDVIPKNRRGSCRNVFHRTRKSKRPGSSGLAKSQIGVPHAEIDAPMRPHRTHRRRDLHHPCDGRAILLERRVIECRTFLHLGRPAEKARIKLGRCFDIRRQRKSRTNWDAHARCCREASVPGPAFRLPDVKLGTVEDRSRPPSGPGPRYRTPASLFRPGRSPFRQRRRRSRLSPSHRCTASAPAAY